MLKLVPASDPILRTKTEKFDFANPPLDPIELYQQLGKALLELDGLGLAAPQIGLPYRAFVIHSDPIIGIFNPIIVNKSPSETILEEACLSYRGLILKVSRHDGIKVRYTEPNGNRTTQTFHGMTARIIQHEIDHLDGIVFGSHVSRLQLEMALKKARRSGFIYNLSDFITTEKKETA